MFICEDYLDKQKCPWWIKSRILCSQCRSLGSIPGQRTNHAAVGLTLSAGPKPG